jgi:hypothetical protein
MKRNAGCTGFAGVLMFLCLALASFGQGSDARPWEKYGLSQTEWKMIQENHISRDKVQMLLSAGISLGEYCKKPWTGLGLTEGDWIEKRRAGLTSYDIELEAKAGRAGRRSTIDTAAPAALSGYASYSSGSNQLIGLLVPGFQQLRLKQTTRGRIMVALAVGSLAACFAYAVIEDRFEPRPLYFVLAPDMLWSFIDFRISIGNMNKKKK